MSTTSTAPRPKSSKASQPSFWKRYSPHGECPISFVGSVLLHLLVPLAVVLLMVWGPGKDGENSKPPPMDVVEIEGEGGGLGGIGVGPGSLDAGKPKRTEGASKITAQGSTLGSKIDEFKLKELPKIDLSMPAWEDSVEAKDGDILAYLERERSLAEKILASQSNDSPAKPGGAGGLKGPGLGAGKGPGKGTSSKGPVLTEQQRHSLRWKIYASYSGEEHLKKLQALKMTLVIPLASQPGRALKYDLSKSTLQPQLFRFAPDEGKMCWINKNPTEMASLAKELKLPEVPICTIIYVPSALEADMARRELAYDGRLEHEIEETSWDVHKRKDGSYETTPYIVKQTLRPGVK